MLKLLKVSQEHIVYGDVNNMYSCAVAQAMHDAKIPFLSIERHCIAYEDHAVSSNGGILRIPHTQVMRNFIDDVDNELEVKPHTFRIKVA